MTGRGFSLTKVSLYSHTEVLDAYIIEEIKRREKEREQDAERPRLYIEDEIIEEAEDDDKSVIEPVVIISCTVGARRQRFDDQGAPSKADA